MLDALLLELDGVVADTRDLRREALDEGLRAEGLDAGDELLAEASDGREFRAAAAHASEATGRRFDAVALDIIAARADRVFQSRMAQGAVLQPGARELMEQAAINSRLAVVTRMPRAVADLVLRLAEVETMVACLIATEDTLDQKPRSAPYALALHRLGRIREVVPGACVALEDGEDGIRSAHGAGLRCLAVGGVPVHVALGADGYLATLAGATLHGIDMLARGEERIG